MLIDESGLVRMMKRACGHNGYTVLNDGDTVTIYTENWCVLIDWYKVTNKVLATVVEHMGTIPKNGEALHIKKGMEPQLVLNEVAIDEMDHWRGGSRGEAVTMTPVTVQECQVMQPPGGGACWGIPLGYMAVIEAYEARHCEADVVDQDRLIWEAEGEAIVIGSIRKACSAVVKEWERAVWNALESVDLHKEEAGR